MSTCSHRSSATARWLTMSLLVFMGLGGCQSSTTPTVYFSGLSDSAVRANAPSYTGLSRTRFTAPAAAATSVSPAPISPTTSPAPASTGTTVSPTPAPAVESLVGGAGTPHLSVTLESAPPSPAVEPFVVVVHLRNDEGVDKAVAYGHLTVGVTSSWLPSGFAAVVNLTTRTVEELSPMAVSGSDVGAVLTPSLLDGYRILSTASYWLPAAVDPLTVAGGLFGNLANSTIEESTRDEQIFTPNLDAFLLVAAPAVPRFPGVTCPPRPTDKVTEVDLDGRPNTERDKEVIYDESVTDMGDGNLSVIVGFIRPNPSNPDEAPDGASSCFVLLIIKDKDGDGKADPEELADARTAKAAGMCVYPRGRNSVERYGDKIVWICVDYDRDGKPTGRAKVFIYDLATGELTVYELMPGSDTPAVVPPSFPQPY